MKRILAIDTCGSPGSIDLFELATGAVLGEATLPGRETQENLLPAVKSVLAGAGCAPVDLFALAVVTGPGSFTGVRIGLAAVKGLAEATGVPVIALSRLAVLATASSPEQGDRVHAWLDAGRGDVYRSTVQAGQHDTSERETLTAGADARAQVGKDDLVVILEPALQDRFPDLANSPVLILQEHYRRAIRALASQSALAGNFADIALLDANYLRIPDAELALRANTALPASSLHVDQ